MNLIAVCAATAGWRTVRRTRKKAETATLDHDQLLRLADTAYEAAVRLRAAQGNRPSRPDDQFTRPRLLHPADKQIIVSLTKS